MTGHLQLIRAGCVESSQPVLPVPGAQDSSGGRAESELKCVKRSGQTGIFLLGSVLRSQGNLVVKCVWKGGICSSNLKSLVRDD